MNGNYHQAKGFTLIEVVIVMVIIGILALIATPIYRSYARSSMASEGLALVSAAANAERIYYGSNGCYYSTGGNTTMDTTLDVDARMNKYFTSFSVGTSGGSTFTAATSAVTSGDASGLKVSLTMSYGSSPTITDNSRQ